MWAVAYISEGAHNYFQDFQKCPGIFNKAQTTTEKQKKERDKRERKEPT